MTYQNVRPATAAAQEEISNLIRIGSSSKYVFQLLKYKHAEELQSAPQQYNPAEQQTVLEIVLIILNSLDVPGTVASGL